MRTGRGTVAGYFGVAGTLILGGLVPFAPWPVWLPIVLLAVLGAAGYAWRHRYRWLSQPPAPEPSFPAPAEPLLRHGEERVTGVLLPSGRADYYFVLSATVCWLPRPMMAAESEVNLAALAVEAVLRWARGITEQRDPGNVSLIQHELAAALAEMREDPSGLVRAMATSVELTLPKDDHERLAKLATVRKAEDIWEHQRRYEKNKREYLSEDALKDPGSAVVWWLARNDQVEKTVQDIGLLARLSCAAKNRDVPETFHRLAPGLGFMHGTDPSAPGFNGTGGHGHSANGASAADYFEAFLGAMDFTESDPKRTMFAHQVAKLVATHGKQEVAEEVAQRFDAHGDPSATEEPADGD